MWKVSLLTLCLVLGTVSSFTVDDTDTLSKYIKALLENFKDEMHKGIPELSIPPLEPLVIPEIDANIVQGIANVQLNIKELVVEKLSTFEIREVKGDMQTMRVELDVFFPMVKGMGHYDLNGKILIFPLFGKGVAITQIDNLLFKLKAGIQLVDMQKIQFSDFKIDAEFSQIQIYLENIVGGGNLGDLVNTLLNGMGKMLFDQFRPLIFTELNRIVHSEINRELMKVNLQDILNGIKPPPSKYGLREFREFIEELSVKP